MVMIRRALRVLAWGILFGGAACTSGSRLPPSAVSPPATPRVATGAFSWEQLPPVTSDRGEVTAVALGRQIYLIGGLARDRTLPDVDVFDPARGAWSTGPDLPVGVNHAMSAELDGTLYVFGGYLGPGLSHPSAMAFALRGKRWEALPPMPEPRAAAGAAAVGGRLYVAGGVRGDGLAAIMMVFDPSSRSWSTEDGPPTRREHLGVAASSGRLYVVGGRTGDLQSGLGASESYDPATGIWTRLPSMPMPRGGLGATATANGLIVTAGGEAGGAFDEVDGFDVQRGRWLRFPPMPTLRHGVGVAALGNVVYVMAGGRAAGFSFSDVNEALDLSAYLSLAS
jgi:hypothetical protein